MVDANDNKNSLLGAYLRALARSFYGSSPNREFLNCESHYNKKISGFFCAKKKAELFSLEVRGIDENS